MLFTFLCVWTLWPGPQPTVVTSWQWQGEVGHPWAVILAWHWVLFQLWM